MKNVYYKDIIKSDFNITEYLKELISEIIDEKFGKIKETQEIEKEKEEVISDLNKFILIYEYTKLIYFIIFYISKRK